MLSWNREHTFRGFVAALCLSAPAFAQEPAPSTRQDEGARSGRAWTVDVTPASYVEAWELNDSVEHLNGLMAGVDRRVWRGVAIRSEGLFFHVRQAGDDTWLRGAALAMRTRRRAGQVRLFLDVGAGASTAGRRVPPSGTRFNYLLLLGGGAEIPLSWAHVTAGLRWMHVSNNGREGRHRNPDIQSLGGFAGVGWTF